MEQAVQKQTEAEIETKDELAAVVDEVKIEAHESPKTYLDNSVVPAGGE